MPKNGTFCADFSSVFRFRAAEIPSVDPFFGVAADAFSQFYRSDFSFRAIVDKKESPLDKRLSRGDFSSAAYSVFPSRVGELVVAFVVEGGDVFADNG